MKREPQGTPDPSPDAAALQPEPPDQRDTIEAGNGSSQPTPAQQELNLLVEVAYWLAETIGRPTTAEVLRELANIMAPPRRGRPPGTSSLDKVYSIGLDLFEELRQQQKDATDNKLLGIVARTLKGRSDLKVLATEPTILRELERRLMAARYKAMLKQSPNITQGLGAAVPWRDLVAVWRSLPDPDSGKDAPNSGDKSPI